MIYDVRKYDCYNSLLAFLTQLPAPLLFSTLHTYRRRGQPVVVSIVQINRYGDLAQIVFWGICRSVAFLPFRAVSILATPIVVLLKFACKFRGKMNVCELSVCLFTKWHGVGKLQQQMCGALSARFIGWSTGWQFEEWNGICKERRNPISTPTHRHAITKCILLTWRKIIFQRRSVWTSKQAFYMPEMADHCQPCQILALTDTERHCCRWSCLH